MIGIDYIPKRHILLTGAGFSKPFEEDRKGVGSLF
jgi:hypothetical protein